MPSVQSSNNQRYWAEPTGSDASDPSLTSGISSYKVATQSWLTWTSPFSKIKLLLYVVCFIPSKHLPNQQTGWSGGGGSIFSNLPSGLTWLTPRTINYAWSWIPGVITVLATVLWPPLKSSATKGQLNGQHWVTGTTYLYSYHICEM